MYQKVVVLCLLGLSLLHAQDLLIAAGAGYKKPVMEVIKNYQKSGRKVDAIFGNMGQVANQAGQTNIALIIGDKRFLKTRSKLVFDGFITIGEGKVVVAYSKNSKLRTLADLKDPKIRKIAMPQPKKAIYGIAGKEFLQNAKLYHDIKDKLFVVATVPQVMTYVASGEVDAGIVNLTAALAFKNKIGGTLTVDQKYYSKIEIVAGKLAPCSTKACFDFIKFLQLPESKAIFTKYGL